MCVRGQVTIGVKGGRDGSARVWVQKDERPKAGLIARMPDKCRVPAVYQKERQTHRILVDFRTVLDRGMKRFPHFTQGRMLEHRVIALLQGRITMGRFGQKREV